jgi:putative transposase
LYDGKRKFTKEEKLKIIKEASEGVKQTLEKYSVFLRVIMLGKRKWKQWAKRVSHGMTPDQLKRIRELEKKISC